MMIAASDHRIEVQEAAVTVVTPPPPSLWLESFPGDLKSQHTSPSPSFSSFLVPFWKQVIEDQGIQKQLYIQPVPDLGWFNIRFFNFMMVGKQYASKTVLWILNFDLSWAKDIQSDPLSWCWAAAGSHNSQSATRSQGEQLIHFQPCCTETTTLFFTFSTVFNKLHEILNTLLQMC